MDSQLLLVRVRPQDDELFSSWLVRLAWSNGEKLHRFCKTRLGITRSIWYHDIDRLADLNAIERSAMKTTIPIERIFAATLASYEGVLYEQHFIKGVSQWIMPIGRYGRSHTLRGQQYCPICLKEDVVPYFRRHWRLSLFVACVKHATLLRDSCPRCDAAISYHEGDFGERTLSQVCPIVFCPYCGTDLRSVRDAVAIDIEVRRLQAVILETMTNCWAKLWFRQYVHSIPYFDGLHWLCRFLASNGETGRIRDHLMQDEGLLPLPMTFRSTASRFQDLRVGDRYLLIRLLAQFMGNWPGRFLGACRAAHVSSSYLREYRRRPLPYWLESEIIWGLDDRHYRPSDEERKSVVGYLTKCGESSSANNVNRWLGVWSVNSKARNTMRPTRREHAGKPRGSKLNRCRRP